MVSQTSHTLDVHKYYIIGVPIPYYYYVGTGYRLYTQRITRPVVERYRIFTWLQMDTNLI